MRMNDDEIRNMSFDIVCNTLSYRQQRRLALQLADRAMELVPHDGENEYKTLDALRVLRDYADGAATERELQWHFTAMYKEATWHPHSSPRRMAHMAVFYACHPCPTSAAENAMHYYRSTVRACGHPTRAAEITILGDARAELRRTP